jgi:hypothetical protein
MFEVTGVDNAAPNPINDKFTVCEDENSVAIILIDMGPEVGKGIN